MENTSSEITSVYLKEDFKEKIKGKVATTIVFNFLLHFLTQICARTLRRGRERVSEPSCLQQARQERASRHLTLLKRDNAA